MIKVTLDSKTPKTVLQYPQIMISDEVVVLFTSPSVGTVIHAGPHHPLGRRSDCWAMSLFNPYHGKITLETEEN